MGHIGEGNQSGLAPKCGLTEVIHSSCMGEHFSEDFIINSYMTFRQRVKSPIDYEVGTIE
uniref:Uncharacterized protein n=1 Tax=Lepeophtheirus salmonis TaxID=72036 RepID=A0A0K2TMH8_LEPSM